MNFYRFALITLLTFIAIPAQAGPSAMDRIQPTLDLEKKIAYQQGQFATLSERCGTDVDRKVIHGSVKAWRTETFTNYKGTSAELKQLEDSFDRAQAEVVADPNACVGWDKQVSATVRSIRQLAQYGNAVQVKQLER
ncbi:MAG: hypothetical protein PHD48_03240 [Alphaproteobacteria bacterium]|nr:hypothetical protein [Alphaproteobacteria bacterium]